MSSADDGKTHTFHFRLDKVEGRYYVRAEPLEGSSSSYNPRVKGDLAFNLSALLGNDDGQFDWGRSFFEKTVSGEPEIVAQPTVDGKAISEDTPIPPGTKITNVRCVLKAKLLDLHGEPKEATIDLHDKLRVKEYKVGEITHHRLTERCSRPSGRTLVLCFDGTSNHFSDKNTNVVKLAELLKKDDPDRQMVYYQTGVGTYSPPGLITPVGLAIASALDQGMAWYLYQHVIDGYKFLMQTYRAGDKIVLFGFSRGAFTARALAGMLHCVGLLPAHNSEHVPFAYQIYKHVQKDCEDPKKRKKILRDKKKNNLFGWLHPSEVDPDDFKEAFSVPVVVDFVGVWDTVASVGALRMKEFRWIEYNPSILVFRQALALDERRGNFIPSLWDHRRTDNRLQDAREVWFRGEHCDVGGGSAGPVEKSYDKPKEMFSVEGFCWMGRRALQRGTGALRQLVYGSPSPEGENEPEPKFDHTMLSNISLRWMVRQMLYFNTGILLDPAAVRRYQVDGVLETPLANGMEPNLGTLGPPEKRKSDDLDEQDVRKDIYESIGRSPLWNALEYLAPTQKPIKIMSPPNLASGHKEAKLISAITRWPNAKAGRSVYFGAAGHPIYIHKSVVDYMDDPKNVYTPRATWHGYQRGQYPPIEDAQTNLSFPEKAQLRLKTVPQPGQDRWAPRSRFLRGCAIAVTLGLLAPSAIPKSEIARLSSYIESFSRLASVRSPGGQKPSRSEATLTK